MLVLTRKLQEQIRISDNITVTVLRIKGNTVRLGIEAPRDVHVVRSELEITLDGSDETPETAASEEGSGSPSLPLERRMRNSSAIEHAGSPAL